MSQQRHHQDDVETLLLELDEADQAGVFHRTQVDVTALLAPVAKPSPSRLLVLRRFVPAAVAAVMVIGVSTWMFRHDAIPQTEPVVAVATPTSDYPFSLCMNGPGSSSARCRVHDYDGDGDVDLADYRLLQLRSQ